MGLVLLVIVVAGSLVFSVQAWRGYDSTSRPEPDGPIDKPVLIIGIIAIVLCSFLPELLAHYTKLSFIERLGIAGAATLLFQFLAFRVLTRVRQKAGDGQFARPQTNPNRSL